ncbi:12015_t:CDS:2, partial [Acaulospora colombiana]
REFSTSEADGRPVAKQVRSESPFIDAEDLPLDPSDAHKILTVLSTIDTDNFMDRIFNFQVNPPAQTTLRSLLQESSKHPLRIIRGAVNQLLPSSSQPRALLAVGASNQQRFVDFAHGLLNQVAARGANTISSKRDTVVASDEERDAEILLPFEERKRKYALVQRLPSGDWWSSSTIPREGTVGLNRASAKQLVTKQAELVSIIPSQPVPSDEMPLFSTLKPLPVTKPKDDSKKPITLQTRTLPAPKLLDYGVFCTFAPYFDSEATEMLEKQKRLSQVEASKHRPAVDSVTGVADINESAVAALEVDEEMRAIDEEPQRPVESKPPIFPSEEVLQNLKNIMHQDETEIFKQALESLRTEFGVTDLLEQTAIALDNL